jgi:hypothetical protein
MEFLLDFWLGVSTAFEAVFHWGRKSAGNYLVCGACTRAGWLLLQRFGEWLLDELHYAQFHGWQRAAQEGVLFIATCILWPLPLLGLTLIAYCGVPIAFAIASIALTVQILEAAYGLIDQIYGGKK